MEAEATGNAVTPETQAVRFHLSKFRSLRDFTGADVTKERVLEEKKVSRCLSLLFLREELPRHRNHWKILLTFALFRDTRA